MKKIKEIIIVEGKKDRANLLRYFEATIFVTGGRQLPGKLLSQLRQLAKNHQLVIFTDPDSSGNYIREKLKQEIPNALQAFLAADQCRKGRKVGIEYAGATQLEEALSQLISYRETNGSLSANDLQELGLCGTSMASLRRRQISSRYHLGDCNSKSLLNRLNCLGIDKEMLQEALADG